MIYNRNKLIQIAQSNPKELARILISPKADFKMLASGAEVLGEEVTDEDVTLPVFRILLKHVNAIVREGACIGLSSFYIGKSPPQDVIDRLQFMSENDPSADLKDYIKMILKDFQK